MPDFTFDFYDKYSRTKRDRAAITAAIETIAQRDGGRPVTNVRFEEFRQFTRVTYTADSRVDVVNHRNVEFEVGLCDEDGNAYPNFVRPQAVGTVR